jgi:CBS-domain-containing membrane protein
MDQSASKLDRLKTALDELGAAGGAARLELHLLGMEAQQRTDSIGKTLDRFEQKLQRGLQEALAGAIAQIQGLRRTAQEFLHGESTGGTSEPTASLFMTPRVRTCTPNDSLACATQIMWDSDCGAVPIVAADGRLCGLVTDRDACMAAYTKGLPLSAIRIADVMAKRVHTCKPDDTLTHAILLMANAEVRRVPVVDGDGRPLGMLSLADVARATSVLGQRDAEALIFRLVAAVSKQRTLAPALAAE